MTKHKHKPKMVMVISIGAKPKKKGETGVKKANLGNCPTCGKYGVIPCVCSGRQSYAKKEDIE